MSIGTHMTTVEEHKAAMRSMEDDIKEKVRMGLLEERQALIGFAVSEASVNCLAILLHRKRLITSGFNVNHRFFSSRKRADEHVPFDLPGKDELLGALVRVEQLRDRLCYGKRKPAAEAEEAVGLFFRIKGLVQEALGEEL